ncbi:protein CNPPD1 [Macrosteles quadrilineatus]|uniref:protein CNPPD1 n=1 Tax=Macrosteles quadrilineatus TaxID=74068 RepID=UPI0023E325FE|nr:protein CNPPD1 [Macrosteles quadrilineatus]
MTVCSSSQRRRRKMTTKLQGIGDHDKFLSRITKTLYCGRKNPYPDHFSLPVTELTAELFSEVKHGCSLDRLHVDQATEISRNTCASPASLVLALLYLERLKTCNSEYIEKVPPSELFLVSMMVASKFLHDDGEEDEVFNAEWAYSGGLKLKEMNQLEREFLNAINWEVYVSESMFWERLRSLESMLAVREGRSRGWFSYTELATLIHASELVNLAHTLITVSAVCLTSYTASVLVMVGSTIATNQMSCIATSLMSASTTTSHTTYHLPSLTDFNCAPAPTTLTNQSVDLPTNLDLENLTLPQETVYARNPESHFVRNRNVWTEQKDWLTAISNIIASHPSTIIPVEIVSY